MHAAASGIGQEAFQEESYRTPHIKEPWIVIPRRNPEARLRLFCFPHAGAGASVFRTWPLRLPSRVEICAIQLPGREGRLLDPPYSNVSQAVTRLCLDLQPYLRAPFAFFGHSLGAVLAFELARRLLAGHGTQPVHLFLSGQPAPQLPPTYSPIFQLGDRQFIDAIQSRYNGIPDEALRSAELMQLLLRPLRADFAMSDTYEYLPGAPLDCPITCYGGLQDRDAEPTQLAAWSKHTTGEFSVCLFPGDHFFLQSAEHAFLRTLSSALMR